MVAPLQRQLSVAEEALLESEARFRELLEFAFDGVFFHDNGTIFDANQGAAKISGYPVEELIGKHLLELLDEPSRELTMRMAKAGVTAPYEVTLRRKDGSSLAVEGVGRPASYRGRPARISVMRDISARRRAEQERSIHADRLAAIGQLAGGVAHELNNPTAFVIASLSSLREELERLQQQWPGARLAEARELLADGIEGIERIRSIAKELRTFARIQHDDVELVDLNEILSSACAIVAGELRERARLNMAQQTLPRLVADRGKLLQALINVLLNAAEAMDARDVERNEIRCTTRHENGKVRVTIADNGCGMPESVRARIFEPFFTTKARQLGTGLGLALCADVVRRHRGEISVESAPGKGSAFELALPEDTGLSLKRAPEPDSLAPQTPQRWRVLVIDDEELLLKVYRRMLSEHHDVVLARGGANAVELLRADASFDVVLCDLMMPEVDGQAVYQAVRAQSPALAARMVFCSGGASSAHLSDFAASLPNVKLDKPFSLAALRAAVEAARARR
jgi:two-component system, cell cycle sensor histidine kinase and response regulator CckA